MIELIAQATQPAAEPLSVTAQVAAAIAVLSASRIVFVLGGDLNSAQPVMRDPVGYALKNTATLAEISANTWQGLRAVHVAHQLANYLTRFRLFLRTDLGSGLCYLFVFVSIALFVWAGKDAPDRSTQDYLLKVAGVLVGSWALLIEKCKFMKKAVELLRVT